MDFAEKILARLAELGLNVNQAEAAGGFPQGYIRGVVRDDAKRATPNVDKAEAIARSLGLDFHIGPPRDPAPVAQVTLDATDYARIPLHTAVLSAGPGAQNGDTAVIEHLVFRQDWLARLGIAPERAALARVTGESMAPGMMPGDVVLIDTAHREIPVKRRLKGSKPPPVFAFIQDGEARMKRIERPEASTLILLSDNQAWPPEILISPPPETLRILGQVVWSGHIWV